MHTSIDPFEQRLRRLETSNRHWRYACAALVLLACATILVGQTAAPSFAPTLICRGIKIVDPEGRKRGEFVMANGSIALRMFDEQGNLLNKLESHALTFHAPDGTSSLSLAPDTGLSVGDPQGAQTVIDQGGFSLLDSQHQERASISLGRIPHFGGGQAIEPEPASLLLLGPTRGYEAFTWGSGGFSY